MPPNRVVFLLFLATLAAPAQEPTAKPAGSVVVAHPSQQQTPTKSKTQPPDARDLAAAQWKERAERLTNDLLEDRWRLHLLGMALPARLAEAWWAVDRRRARNWLDESIQSVTFAAGNESTEVRKDRLQAAEIVIDVANRLDPSESDEIVAMLVELAKQDRAAGNNRTANMVTGMLTNSVSQSVADGNTSGTAQALDALVQLRDQNIHLALSQIAWKDAGTANRVYADAIAAASSDNGSRMFFGLAEYAFPTLGGPPTASLPDALRGQLLDAIVAVMTRPTQSDEEQKQVCTEVAPVANRLLDKFSAVQASIVRPVIEKCKTLQQNKNDDSVPDACASVDECLKAGDVEAKTVRKARIKEQAAMMATIDRDPLRALDIMDGLSDEERAALPDWSQQRLRLLAMSLDSLHKAHDTDRIQRLLDDTPDNQRAEAMIAFSNTLMRGDDKPYGVLMLSQARATLEKSPADNPYVYLQLLGSYTRYLPEEAPQVLGLVVSGLNQIKYKDPKDAKDGEAIFLPPGARLNPEWAGAALLDNYDAYVFASIKALDDPRTRAAFRLGCLEYSLKRYQEELKKGPSVSPKAVSAKPAAGPAK
jgi:hypothetical protein